MKTYPVGSFFVVQVEGVVGFLIALGQLLCLRPSAYGHCGIVISASGDTMEAQPGGARPGHLANYAGRLIRVCDGPILREAATGVDTARLRADVAAEAVKLRGVPYSPLDYVALGMLHLHIPAAGWVRRRVETSGHLICSALVDRAYARAGIHLFTDPDRLPGDVMPADLADWADTWQEATA